jgi:hypothetical protein
LFRKIDVVFQITYVFLYYRSWGDEGKEKVIGCGTDSQIGNTCPRDHRLPPLAKKPQGAGHPASPLVKRDYES